MFNIFKRLFYHNGMKSILILGAAVFLLTGSAVVGWNFVFPPKEVAVLKILGADILPQKPVKTKEELIAEALEKSSRVKGLYMTSDVANDQGAAGTRIRNNLVRLADTTEINGLVIDVKEACGVDYDKENLGKLLFELRQKSIWAIARIVVFSDSSRIDVNPEWYLTRKSPKKVGVSCYSKKHLRLKNPIGEKSNIVFWQDKAGRYWLDPAHPEAQSYVLKFSKEMIDLGFDELQYDYIRFPSDGDVENAIYPFWDKKRSQCIVMRDFFRYLNKNLKEYRPDIILSADLFGYSSLGIDTGIGQCIESIEDNFDYVSFMVYPSHYYGGLRLTQDPSRNLPAINFNLSQARANPGEVVHRSLLWARDFFDGRNSTTTLGKIGKSASGFDESATSSPNASELSNPATLPRSRVRLRPWLEDFFHEQDKSVGRPAYTEKVRLQIEAAEKVEEHGWMLWNAGNIYSEGALRKE